ncbi:extracellular solute-binding protein [Paraburkholderia sp. CNPSo 3076]|uniref:extracellular solute-binding protein n=1 Tax=Paraburkholderia sp. CNPSo 3076 TaxID=2940936 RepID=UPI002257DE4B|nr:extracellular solute-binding protein [Paraburkholderia sp. CNPSo 3076]MCX5544212.1 extracellular solute-binding protein [Paraburkholderia sp. CNPSo 3076]
MADGIALKTLIAVNREFFGSRWTEKDLAELVCLFAVLAAVLPATSAHAQQLVIASFGGAYTASQSKAFFEPYTAKTGTKILPADYNGGLAELRSQVQAGSGAWDVIDLEFQDAARACDEGLIDPIKASSLAPSQDGKPASADFVDGSLLDCGVGTILWSNVIAYDKRKFSAAQPTTIADFFDLKKFPGKRGLSNKPNGNLEWALMADGVPRDKVYATLRTPAGLERAFKKLDTIKPSAVFWGAQAQSVQLLADGEVAMTEGGNGRFTDAITKEKKPFGIVWQGQIINGDLQGEQKQGGCTPFHPVCDIVAAACKSDEVHQLRARAPLGTSAC